MKGRVTITVDKDQYDFLIQAGVNCSGLADEVFTKEAKRIKAERWKEENRAGMAEVAAFIEEHGSLNEMYRGQ
ncbi:MULTISPECIES: type II toxin-antitoxin system CcdA family antitoxin [Pantoea]|uniref:Antitoxin CcdA n=1 Tax=Candidatus Pantoea floridensis TaxID=1938870 RepID=A0A286BLB5_9GAMM|nr:MULTISPECIES: type II toxin-antitoxin system CcdA family antitoxin [Pantoea]PIF22281.1 antitoxin CcdA [Enterobacteriaceae bacterium JKS000233]PXW22265.1 antitoxin CcdA [Pantoea sp. JKS000250]SOD34931.1 antitoxin CcdA [Pantoea floridensis]